MPSQSHGNGLKRSKKQCTNSSKRHVSFSPLVSETSFQVDEWPPPDQVRKWTRKELKRFHILYADRSVSNPLEFLYSMDTKVGKEQKRKQDLRSCDELPKAKHFSPPNSEMVKLARTLNIFQYFDLELDMSVKDIKDIKEQIEYIDRVKEKYLLGRQNIPIELLSEIDKKYPNFSSLVNLSIHGLLKFLQQLQYILHFKEQGESEVLHEMAYRDLYANFSACCLMTPMSGDSITRFLRMNIEDKFYLISSQPDVRFVKDFEISEMIVTIAEINKSAIEYDKVTEMTTGPQFKELEESEESEEFNINLLHHSILARHAGELLVERRVSLFSPYVVGSIVLETKVILTYMHMSDEQEVDIRESNSFQDNAIINYSRPLDFLRQEDRSILFDIMMMLGLSQLEKD